MLSSKNLDKLRTMLVEAVDQHLANGGKIIKGAFDNGHGGCCPVNCLTGPITDGKGFHEMIAIKLGIQFDADDLWNLVDGFDEYEYPRTGFGNNPLYNLGRELRAKYLPKTTP